MHTSGWELCGNRAISGLSEEPGRRYSGAARSGLADSVFGLLEGRLWLFPFSKLESAEVAQISVRVYIFKSFLHHCQSEQCVQAPGVGTYVSVSSILGERPSLRASSGPDALSSSRARARWSLAERAE